MLNLTFGDRRFVCVSLKSNVKFSQDSNETQNGKILNTVSFSRVENENSKVCSHMSSK